MKARALGGVGAHGVGRALLLAWLLTGCSELQARSHARAGNAHYLQGDYVAAVREYELADRAYPELFEVALNKGLAYRQLMTPGSHSPEQAGAVDGALAAFAKAKALRPRDPRGNQLYLQVLFDDERYDTLIDIYEAQLIEDPRSLLAINGLISVHSRAGHRADALHWAKRRADVDANDAEAQYAVGALIFNRLFQKGGSDNASFDPHPDDADPQHRGSPTPPVFNVGDVMGEERSQTADVGIAYLRRALQIRPTYREAMLFARLLCRQKALAYPDNLDFWDACMHAAEEWRQRAERSPAHGTSSL